MGDFEEKHCCVFVCDADYAGDWSSLENLSRFVEIRSLPLIFEYSQGTTGI